MNQLCKVCGEPAAGFHFGAFTCEGCKSFFGRTYNNLSSLSDCKNNGRCVINKKNRTSCKSCRLRKCLLVGMSKSGSRYGRRSNWFKIHCLLQDQATNNISSSDTAALLSSHKLIPSPPTSSAPYELIREMNRHFSPLGGEERTSSASPGTGGGDSSSETESKVPMGTNGYHQAIYGGMDTPSPPYDRREANGSATAHHQPNISHHLPMSPVSPVSPHGQFVYNHGLSPNGMFLSGRLRPKQELEPSRNYQPIPFLTSYHEAMIKNRIVAPRSSSPFCLKKDCDDVISGDCLGQEKPMDLSLRLENSSPTDTSASPKSSCAADVDKSPQIAIKASVDAPLDLTRK